MKEPSIEPCIFCRIARGEIPSYKIYEDENYMAFLDINPINPGHTLVIPKSHYKTITDAPKEVWSGLMALVWDLALKIQKKLDPDGLNIIQNNNVQAGQVVPHIHVHIIPRYGGDEENYKEWKTMKLPEEEFKKLQNYLK